jgi:hypothetical protein
MMIVEQDVLDLLADEAPFDPENVQVVARLARAISGAAVGSGAAAGAATVSAAAPSTRARERRTIFVLFSAGTMNT